MRRRDHVERGLLDLGVRLEVGPDERAVPGPVDFGVAGGVDSEPAPAALDVGPERGLRGRVQHVAGRVEEDDGGDVGPQRAEVGRVLGRRDGEPAGGGDLAERPDAGRDRGVAEPLGPREHDHALAVRVGRAGRRGTRVPATRDENEEREQPDHSA